MAPLDIDVSTTDTHTVVTVVGELDLDSQENFADLVVPAAEASSHLVLDLTGVGFIDSSGLGALARVKKVMMRRDLPAHVVPSPRVRSALRLTGLTEAFVVHDSIEEAVSSVASTSSETS